MYYPDELKPNNRDVMQTLLQGDKIYVIGTVEAFRTGLKRKECRVNVGGETIWIDASCIKECE